jgi:hypothetical protein
MLNLLVPAQKYCCRFQMCGIPTAISHCIGNLLRDAASNVSSCSTWQLTYKKLIHRFDAQASWQGNRWVISLFLSLRSTPLASLVLSKLHSALDAAGSARNSGLALKLQLFEKLSEISNLKNLSS